jgi:CHRD domain
MGSRARYLVIVAASAAAVTAIAVGVANAGARPEQAAQTAPSGQLVALLNGANEVDNAGTPNVGDPDAAGYAVVEVDRPNRQVCVRDLRAAAVDGQIHLFHIHSAPAGQNGPVVVDFVPLLATGGIGCVSVTDKTLLSDIAAFPEEYYINVHSTPNFPAGAVRGQLHTLATPSEVSPPPSTVPDTTMPDTTMPDTTMPDTTMPDTTMPDTTMPDTTAADTTIPYP